VRRLLCLALLLLMPAAAPAPVAAQPNPAGPVYNVKDWGGVAGNNAGIDDALELIYQAIKVRDAANPGGPRPATIYFPSDINPYYLKYPFIVDRPYIEIVGDGRRLSNVRPAPGYANPCFVFGVPRIATVNNQTISLSADHWTDLYGILDGTAVARAGQRFGLRTKSDAFLTFWSSPFNAFYRSQWSGVRRLTISFAVQNPAGGQLAAGNLFGMGSDAGPRAGPRPWVVECDQAGRVRVRFRCLNNTVNEYGDPDNWGSERRFTFPCTATGLVKVDIQIDLVNAAIQAWVNGTQQTITRTTGTGGSGASFTAGDNLAFIPCEFHPFNVGTFTDRSNSFGTGVTGNITGTGDNDILVCGLRLAEQLTYVDDPGNPQHRIDAKPITDQLRYFDGANGCLAYLPLQDGPPGTVAASAPPGTATPTPAYHHDGRLVGCRAGPGTGYGGLLTHGLFGQPAVGLYVSSRNGLRNLTIGAGPTASTRYGDAVSIGTLLGLDVSAVEAYGGIHGIGSINSGACYIVRVRDTECVGTDAGYYGYWQVVHASRLNFGYPGRTALRLVGCNLGLTDGWSNAAPSNCECVVKLHYSGFGGNYQFRNLANDTEGGPTPSLAAIYAEGVSGSFGAVSLRIEDLNLATIGPNAAVVDLRDLQAWPSDSTKAVCRAQLMLDGVTLYPCTADAWVRTNGPLWQGEVRNLNLVNAPKADDGTRGFRLLHMTGAGVANIHDMRQSDNQAGPP
jgi:hypothetical protein